MRAEIAALERRLAFKRGGSKEISQTLRLDLLSRIAALTRIVINVALVVVL